MAPGIPYDFAEIDWKGISGFVNYASGDTDDGCGKAFSDKVGLDFIID